MDTSPEYDSYAAENAAHVARHQEAWEPNKAAIFAAMEAAGVSLVTVEFDGCGDSGQIDAVSAYAAGGAAVALPIVEVEVRDMDEWLPGTGTARRGLEEAIEAVVYALLARTHGGWEDNDGAFGEVSFDLANRAVTLDFNGRFADSTHTQHVF